jgi:hypothetical protein
MKEIFWNIRGLNLLGRKLGVGGFCTSKNRVVKIACSSSEMVL